MDPYEVVAMRDYRTIAPQDLMLGEKIGEGQFGDVHNGFLYPKVSTLKCIGPIKECLEIKVKVLKWSKCFLNVFVTPSVVSHTLVGV